MKKLLIILTVALASCSEQIHVKLGDGKLIKITKPDVMLTAGDTVVIREISGVYPTEHSFYGYYVGKLPYNPDPCNTYKIDGDSTNTRTYCIFYEIGIIVK